MIRIFTDGRKRETNIVFGATRRPITAVCLTPSLEVCTYLSRVAWPLFCGKRLLTYGKRGTENRKTEYAHQTKEVRPSENKHLMNRRRLE